MKRTIILLIAIIQLTFPAQASTDDEIQEPQQTLFGLRKAPDYNYNLFGFSLGTQQTSFLSPIYYTSFGIGALAGSYYQKRIYNYSTDHQFSFIMGAAANDKSKITTNYDFLLNFSFPMPSTGLNPVLPNLSLGVAYWLDFDVTTKGDNQNNPVFFNLSNMLCFSVGLKKSIRWLHIHNEFIMPFAGIYMASEFGNSLPYFFFEDDAKLRDAFHFGSFGMNNQLVNRLNLDVSYRLLYLSGTIRFQYEIATQNFNLNNNTKHYAFHTLRLGILIQKTVRQYVYQ